MQGHAVITDRAQPVAATGRRAVLYPQLYLWFVFLSALDVMLTWCILTLDGAEVNPLARAVIVYGDLYGLVIYKFVLVSLVLLICEFVGRRRPAIGRAVSTFAVVVTTVPVVMSMLLLPLASFTY